MKEKYEEFFTTEGCKKNGVRVLQKGVQAALIALGPSFCNGRFAQTVEQLLYFDLAFKGITTLVLPWRPAELKFASVPADDVFGICRFVVRSPGRIAAHIAGAPQTHKLVSELVDIRSYPDDDGSPMGAPLSEIYRTSDMTGLSTLVLFDPDVIAQPPFVSERLAMVPAQHIRKITRCWV